VYVVAYSPDGTKIATGGYDRNVKVWDSTTGERLSTLEHISSVLSRCLAWTSDGKKLVFGEPLIRIFDTTTWEQIAVLYGHTFAINAIILTRNDRLLASASVEPQHKPPSWSTPPA
jgi:WD40 repeat protein